MAANRPADFDPQKRINQMITFITDDAKKQADEILMKADEEFQIEKGRILNPERIRIQLEYDKKLKVFQIEQRIEDSKRINEARLQVLKERDKLMKQTQEKTFQKLGDLKKDVTSYQKLMRNLIIQGLIRMDEKTVEIQVVKDDLNVVKAVFEGAIREYISIMQKETGRVITPEVKVDENDFLPIGVVGGVMLKGRKGKIVLDNTLQSRLKVASGTLMPILRGRLFGVISHQGVNYDKEVKPEH